MPTSMTQAPGLTIAAVTISAARRRRRGRRLRGQLVRSMVFEWQMVTVASFCKRSSASGLPTMLEPRSTPHDGRNVTPAWLD